MRNICTKADLDRRIYFSSPYCVCGGYWQSKHLNPNNYLLKEPGSQIKGYWQFPIKEIFLKRSQIKGKTKLKKI